MSAKIAPSHFPLARNFKGVSADQVREWLRSAGFTRHDRTPMLEVYQSRKLLGASEIWFIECNTTEGSGFAAARLDLQGHAKKEARWTVRMEENTADPRKHKRIKEVSSDPIAVGGVQQFYFEQVPHYHKEWVGSESLTKYLTEFVPDIARYDDEGRRVEGPLAKIAHLIHILR